MQQRPTIWQLTNSALRLCAACGYLWIIVAADFVQAQTNGPEMTVRIVHKGRGYVGLPLAQDGTSLAMLRLDGRLTTIPFGRDADVRKLADGFQPFSPATLRRNLLKEFGGKYQVSITPNFVVVHPEGDYDTYALPFEQLYQRFRAYFLSRGMALEDPRFPLIAVVLKSRDEFARFLKTYHDYDRNIFGYYSPRSNRIITYQPDGGSRGWSFESTLIHEAAHQSAFNTGVHSRFSPTPRWISEGLAMMFEAPGVNNSQYYSRRADRVNRSRLQQVRRYLSDDRLADDLESLIASDRLFREDPDRAYALSWALTFYLAETQPREYFEFLRADSSRAPFSDYAPSARTRSFFHHFQHTLPHLTARMRDFLVDL